MSTQSELAALNATGAGELSGNFADKGLSTGFQTNSHGVSFGPDSTNALGSITGHTGSDPMTQSISLEDRMSGGCMGGDPDFTGSLGSFDAGSHAPGEENANDADTGKPEAHNYG